MILSYLEWLSKIFNDKKRRAVSLRQLSFLFSYLTLNNIVTLKSGHWRSFNLVPFESFGAVSYSPSMVTMAASCIISETKRDIRRKLCYFHTPLYLTPPLGGEENPTEYYQSVRCGKTRMVGLPGGKNILRICSAVSTEYRRVTDGQITGLTDRHIATASSALCILRYSSRGKNVDKKWYT